MPADYNAALVCLKENLTLLSDATGKAKPEHQIMWNLSNSLLVMVDALRHLERKFET